MKRSYRLLLIVFVLAAGSMPAMGQKDVAHPDFSGTWKVNSKKSGLSPKSPFAGEIMVIKCNGLTIEMRHASSVDGHEIVQTYIADGEPHLVQQTKDAKYEVQASWDRSTLRTARTTRKPNERPIVIAEQWSLSKDGRRLERDATFSGIGYVSSMVYDKQD